MTVFVIKYKKNFKILAYDGSGDIIFVAAKRFETSIYVYKNEAWTYYSREGVGKDQNEKEFCMYMLHHNDCFYVVQDVVSMFIQYVF